MLLEIALLFIFLNQPFKHQVSLVGIKSLAGFKSFSSDPSFFNNTPDQLQTSFQLQCGYL